MIALLMLAGAVSTYSNGVDTKDRSDAPPTTVLHPLQPSASASHDTCPCAAGSSERSSTLDMALRDHRDAWGG